jgi:hypothetical protein
LHRSANQLAIAYNYSPPRRGAGMCTAPSIACVPNTESNRTNTS